MMGTWQRFQFRNDDFCPRSRKSRDCAEAYSGMPHKQSRRLTQRLGKKTIYGWKLIIVKTICQLILNKQNIGAITYIMLFDVARDLE